MLKRFFLTIAIILAFTSMAHAAVFLIARGPKYIRVGIDDVGDIYEIFEGPYPPSGPGYALADIVEIGALNKTDVDSVLATCKKEVIYDEKTGKEYWYDTVSDNWYEIKIKPKYELNLANLTVEDKAALASSSTPSPVQIGILGEKIISNITKYPQNSETIRPEE